MGDNERLCAMEIRLRLKRFPPQAGSNSRHVAKRDRPLDLNSFPFKMKASELQEKLSYVLLI